MMKEDVGVVEEPVVEERAHKHRHRHHHRRNKEANEIDFAEESNEDPYSRHRAYQDSYLVLQEKLDEASNAPLSEHETKEMEFFLDNGLLVLAQQIAQE